MNPTDQKTMADGEHEFSRVTRLAHSQCSGVNELIFFNPLKEASSRELEWKDNEVIGLIIRLIDHDRRPVVY